MNVVAYDPSRKQDLIDLNTWWIDRYFGGVEAEDLAEFEHVDEEVERGGMAFFATDDDGHAQAVCMALDRGEEGWEIAKLGSDPNTSHPGAGRAVFEACVEWAREHGARRIYILTNSSLKAAIHIYESHGFVRYQPEDMPYARGDYALQMYL